MAKQLHIYPSLMAAPLDDIKGALKSIRSAEGIHFDVMDGHFVPNITFGADMLAYVKKNTALPIMVHLMVENPEKALLSLAPFLTRNDIVIIHIELGPVRIKKALAIIKRKRIHAGLTLKPSTSIEKLAPYLASSSASRGTAAGISNKTKSAINTVLLLGAQPGFYGQRMTSGTITRVHMLAKRFPTVRIYVDEGVTLENAKRLKQAGATGIISGKAIFKTANPAKAIAAFHRL